MKKMYAQITQSYSSKWCLQQEGQPCGDTVPALYPCNGYVITFI